MKKPTIAKEIKKQGNIVAGCSAFIGLGIAGISALNFSPAATLMLCGSMIPVAIDIIGLKLLIENPNPESFIQKTWWLDKPFRKRMDKWLVNYINDSESITEKKYKVGCLSIWMNIQGITLDNISDKKTYKYLSELSKELINSKETQKEIPLQYFFGDAQGPIKDIFGVEPSIKTFLNEDKNKPEKIEIAKEVYKEYSNIGLAAKAFVNRKGFEELFILQDYKLTPQDYDVIEAHIKNAIERNINDKDFNNLYSREVDYALDKLIDTENNIDNLKILGKYCTEIYNYSSYKNFIISINNKLEYLELDSELEVKEIGDKPKAKKMKI